MAFYHDVPASQGVANALKRAKQMVDIRWTPRRVLPSSHVFPRPGETERTYVDSFIPDWRPQQGMVYSSTRPVEKFVGFNVSLETFVTALSNPNSVLYTRTLHGQAGHALGCYYGIVCSCFASYVCDLPYRVTCKHWPEIEGVTEVDTTELENLQLCDLVLNTKRHIAVITDILRDENGKVRLITVSESVLPNCIALPYTPEEFRGYWLEHDYRIFRYAGIHNVTYTPNTCIHLEGDPELTPPPADPVLMTDFGDKANYILGDEPVEISVLQPGWQTVRVASPEGTVRDYSPVDGKVILHPATVGLYSACCVRNGEQSHSVSFCVTDLQAESAKPAYAVGEPITLRFRNAAPDTPFVCVVNHGGGYIRQLRLLTPEQGAAGEVTLPGIAVPGPHWALVIAKNAYGAYTSRHIAFDITDR